LTAIPICMTFWEIKPELQKSGVAYIAEPGGSIRDDHVIMTCNKYNMAMAFTGIRLFHH
jgi:phosphoribosylaminoimidazolecarboxamide formyltransferase/IMP cyclohydrolase